MCRRRCCRLLFQLFQRINKTFKSPGGIKSLQLSISGRCKSAKRLDNIWSREEPPLAKNGHLSSRKTYNLITVVIRLKLLVSAFVIGQASVINKSIFYCPVGICIIYYLFEKVSLPMPLNMCSCLKKQIKFLKTKSYIHAGCFHIMCQSPGCVLFT